MRRLPVLLCALALVCAACSNGDAPPTPTAPTAPTAATGTGSPATPPPSPSPTTLTQVTPASTPTAPPSPTPLPDVQLPSGMAVTIDDPVALDAISAGDVTPLIPPGSSVGRSVVLISPDDPLDQVAVTWVKGEPTARRAGLIV